MPSVSALSGPKRAIGPALVGIWSAAVGLAPTPQSKLLVLAPIPLGAVAWWTMLRPERWLALYFFCSLLLPPLPFPIGNAGLHVAPLVALLGLLAGMLRFAEWRTEALSQSRRLVFLFAFFFLVLFVSVAFAAIYSGWEVALESLARVFLFGIGVYVFIYTLAGPREEGSDSFAFARLLFWIALAGAIFGCVDFYFQLPAPAGYAEQYVWLAKGAVRRAQGLFYEASTLGNFCAFFLTMILVAAFPPAGRRSQCVLSRLVLIPGLLIFTSALILSASRASIVTVIVASCAFLYMRRVAVKRVLITIGFSLAAAAAVVSLILPEFFSHYRTRTFGSLQYLRSAPDSVLSGRLTHWSRLADFLLQHPWHVLFGIGYKTLPYTTYLGAPVVADNTFLSLLIETGILGLAVFILLNGTILRTAFRAARSSSGRASFFGLWIFCFWCGELVQMLSGDLITYWRVLPVYFWVLATAARESSDGTGAGFH